MAESWNSRLTNASDKVFPGLTYYNSHNEKEFIALGVFNFHANVVINNEL
jgi:hypothetical protein